MRISSVNQCLSQSLYSCNCLKFDSGQKLKFARHRSPDKFRTICSVVKRSCLWPFAMLIAL